MTNSPIQIPFDKKFLKAGIYLFGLVALLPAVNSLAPSLAFAEAVNKARQTDTSPITIEAAEFLEWNQNEGTYIAKGKAFVQQSDTRINAAHIIARYNAGGETRNINHFIATGEVTYVEGESTAKGDKLDYDLTASFYLLTGKNASVEGPRGKMTATKSITYDAAEDANRKVTATGNARYKTDDGRIVFGEKLIAHIAADGTLKTIDAYENTKVITTNGTKATADKLNYVANTALASLDGNVEIIDNENIMRGDRAKIDFDKEISRIISNPGGKRVSGTLTP
jgi:lipopolysaccharide export system protein LptA